MIKKPLTNGTQISRPLRWLTQHICEWQSYQQMHKWKLAITICTSIAGFMYQSTVE
jgi:hypothetical protein